MSKSATHSRAKPAPSRNSSLIAGVVLVVVVIAAYSNTFRVPFLLDDRSAITENPTIMNLGDLGTVLTPTKITTSGRPLLNLSYALNYATGGQSVVGYHVVNLAIHVLAALTLFGILRRTFRTDALAGCVGETALPLAFFGAALWALHPVLTSAVTYLSQRAESLMGLFYLLTLYAFIRTLEPGRALRWKVISVVCCFAGVITKEVMITAPVVVLLYDRVFVAGSFKEVWSKRRGYYAGLVASWVLLVYLAIATQLGERSVAVRAGQDWLNYALTEFRVVTLYVKLALWPSPLVFDYGQEILSREFLPALPFALAVIAALGGTIYLFVRGAKGLGLLSASFFILLSPTSSFVPVVGQPMAESRLYLPLIAIVMLVVLGLYRAFKGAAWYVCGAAVVMLGVLTFARNQDYRSALTIWEDTIEKRPLNSRGQYNFANELAKDPRRASEALAHYETAVRLKPDLMEAHNNLANELAKDPARANEALAHYDEALRLNPDLKEAQFNAARLLDQNPVRLLEAISRWERVVSAYPGEAEAHFKLANDLIQIPDWAPNAIAHYETALRLKPDWVEAHNNLANELAKFPGRLPEAIAHYETALKLDPSDAAAHLNLANKLSHLPGRMPEAFQHYETALKLKPDFVEAHYSYANRLANEPGRLPEAVAHYEAALRVKPNLPEAHKNLALALANLGQLDEAARHLQIALDLRPNYAEARQLLEQVRAAQK